MKYSTITGLIKAFRDACLATGILFTNDTGLQNLTVPATYEEFLSRWSTFVIPISVFILKFCVNFYKIGFKSNTEPASNDVG